MAGLRATHLSLNPTENEGTTRLQNAKMAAATGRTTRGRTAMSDIANQGTMRAGLRSKDANIIKPARMIVKQKATASLRSLAEAPKPLLDEKAPAKPTLRRKRKCSAEKDEAVIGHLPTPMECETVVLPASEDVEMMDVSEAKPAFSTENLAEFNIEDIDSEDAEDPQLVVEYVNDVYVYMRQLEAQQSIRKDYLKGRGVEILPKMRSVLVDWLVGVHQQFTLLQETLYLAVAILDRFMQVNTVSITRKQLQLIGVTSLFIAAKYEEMYPPEIGDFVYITDNAYTQSQIRDMEMTIMNVLRFQFGRPLPLHFLRRNSKAGQVDATAHTMAKYVMELTLLDYELVHVLPSKIAAASLAFALKVLDQEGKTLEELWTPTIAYYSQYSLEAIKPTLRAIAGIAINTTKASERAKMMAIRKKYSHKKFGKISEFPELTGQASEELAEGQF